MDRSLARRLHSISGVVPAGRFLAFHLTVNASASRGAEAYNATARRLQDCPAADLARDRCSRCAARFHGVDGLFLIADRPAARAERARPRGARLAVFQRATGVPLFALHPVPPLDGAPRPGRGPREPRPLPPDAGRSVRAPGSAPPTSAASLAAHRRHLGAAGLCRPFARDLGPRAQRRSRACRPSRVSVRGLGVVRRPSAACCGMRLPDSSVAFRALPTAGL